MLHHIGASWSKLAQGRELDRLTALAIPDPKALAFDTGAVIKGGVLLRGERLNRSHWSVHAGRRLCLECFASDRREGRIPRQWHRSWWDVQPITICAVHSARLLTSCPQCGTRLDFHSTSLDRCSEGHSLFASVDRVSHHAGDTYLLGRLSVIPLIRSEVLDKGTLGEVVQALDLVGMADLGAQLPSASREIPRHIVLDAGYRGFAGWPTTFDTILESLLARSNVGLGRWGAAATYGAFHRRLSELRNGPIIEELKQRTRLHAYANGVSPSRTVFGIGQASKGFYSIREGAACLGYGFDRGRREFAKHNLIPNRTRRGTPVLIPKAAIDRLKDENREAVTTSFVAQTLRIGPVQARKLVASAVFNSRTGLNRSDVHNVLERLSKHGPARNGRDGKPLPSACQSARCPIDVAVRAIFDGRVPLVGFRSGQGLTGVLVRIPDLRAQAKLNRGAMTIKDAAGKLNLKWQTVKGLIDLGLLPVIASGIQPSALAAFQAEYVSGAQLARAIGLRPRSLINVVARAGIAPTAAPPRCRQTFYRRQDIRNGLVLRTRYPALLTAAQS